MPDNYIDKQANVYRNAKNEASKTDALWRIGSYVGEGFEGLDPTGKLTPEQRKKAEDIANNVNNE